MKIEEILKMLKCWADETDGGFVVLLARPVTLNGEAGCSGRTVAFGNKDILNECMHELQSRMARSTADRRQASKKRSDAPQQ